MQKNKKGPLNTTYSERMKDLNLRLGNELQEEHRVCILGMNWYYSAFDSTAHR